MLSRVADSLYWMSRNVERAENIARIVEVNQQLMLDVPSQQAVDLQRNWLPVIACLGEEPEIDGRPIKPDAGSVTEFLVFERGNPNSIVSCLCAARENARTVREQISAEMWEQINRTYLWCLGKSARQSFDRNQYEFFQRLKKSLQLFQGITETTMIHEDGWDFIQLGKYLERADKTSRLLDDEYHLLRRDKATANDHILQWLAVLRSCSARQTYQKIYATTVQPVKVAELLILHESFPRSVKFCAMHLDEALRRISGVPPGRFSNHAEKLSGRLVAELSFSSIDDLHNRGLHQAVDDLQVKFNAIGSAIFATYIYQAITPAAIIPEVQQVPQE
ncbi:MAG TPA: alpha-E domain-containing protein [Methylomirabilota bacterium]|nr:alpha-E domain-containing protein [Methylomirabilota bacterium]